MSAERVLSSAEGLAGRGDTNLRVNDFLKQYSVTPT